MRGIPESARIIMSPARIDFEGIVNKANDIIMVMAVGEDGSGARIVYVNEAFTRLTGYAAEEVVGKSPRLLQAPETSQDTIREVSAALHSGRSIRCRLLNRGKDGERHWLEASIVPLPAGEGHVTHFAAIERDVTAEMEHEQALEVLASTDPLTKLANRRRFVEVMEREFGRARRTGKPLSLVALDLDHFKRVNDTWGHDVGDRVLVAFANMVHDAVRAYDCVARIGGEEFSVMLPDTDRADALQIAQRICKLVAAEPLILVGDCAIAITCSGGLTSLADRDETAASLMLRADRALYFAKSNGRNRVHELSPELLLAATH
ncbi:MAG TPA: diguanylate cyclase [Stellaceae bacterium]|nr:diguanylate cyclase [Stellaceae bacterium]